MASIEDVLFEEIVPDGDDFFNDVELEAALTVPFTVCTLRIL